MPLVEGLDNLSVRRALREKRELASRCKRGEIVEERRDLSGRLLFLFDAARLPAHLDAIASARCLSQMRSGRRSSPSFFLKFSSNQRPR